MRSDPFRQICPGHLVRYDGDMPFRHAVGGTNDLLGAECENCRKPLLLYMMIDASDSRLGLHDSPAELIPLLYCPRCALQWHEFSYRVISNGTIEQLEFLVGHTDAASFYKEVNSDVFIRRSVRLEPTTPRFDAIQLRAMEGEITLAEATEYAAVLRQPPPDLPGGYPPMQLASQVGGRPYLMQGSAQSWCSWHQGTREAGALDLIHRGGARPHASKHTKMGVLAVLTDNDHPEVRLGASSAQVVFYLCRQCYCISARYMVD
jgi:hypothetical protein